MKIYLKEKKKHMKIIHFLDAYSNIIAIVSIILTIWSLFVTFKSNNRAKIEIKKREDAEKALKSITWEDMQRASEKIARQLIKAYQPAVIYIPNIKSGIMLQFIRNYFKEYIPVIVGQTIAKEYFSENACNKLKGLENYWYVNTQKWHVYIPKILLEYKSENILIIDNLSLTGNFLSAITKELINQGISNDHIITACIATTEAAIADHVAPQYYYKTLTDSKTVYMPWGI